MIRVKNQRAIANLARKSLRANRTRNAVAVAAIALTTLLFTALFTIALSLNAGFQDANFRSAGGYNHGTFKYLTQEQYLTLRQDPGIRQWGLRRFLGMPKEAPFQKDHVEVGYSDANQAHWMYCDPIAGRLPQEGTDEAATDTHVLELLGVEPELGARFSLTFWVDGKQTTQSFSLCGWWEYDEAVTANHVLIPESRVDAILQELALDPAATSDNSGSWNLDVMLPHTWDIAAQMDAILARHGLQSDSPSAGDNFIATGVNWGYTSSQLSSNLDAGTLLVLALLLALIVFTGYLIIYNVFQISVVRDIRFYGMLKTIGATPRQLRRIIRRQALTLSALGIPLGLVLGWGVGAGLTPAVARQLNGITVGVQSVHPLLFLGAALFSLGTVLLSCARPGRLAGQVSPIEALRYTEGNGGKRKSKRTAGASLPRMAWANLGRSRGKTAVTVLSLSLAVLLLTLTVTFTRGFDLNKYLSRQIAADFILADAQYFQVGQFYSQDSALPESAIQAVQAQEGVQAAGRVYGNSGLTWEAIDEAYFRTLYGQWNSAEMVEQRMQLTPRDEAGLLLENVQLYGMEAAILDRLTLVEGDLTDLYAPGSHSVAAVYHTDDYGKPVSDSNWAKLGDTLKVQYVDAYDYVDPVTKQPVDPASGADWEVSVTQSHTETYTVTALVAVPHSLSYRYYGTDAFVLNSQTFVQDSGESGVLLYAFDTAQDTAEAMEAFLADYTTTLAPGLGYQSMFSCIDDFESFRAMFLLLGGVLSLVVGLVGILNFFNAVLTGILARRQEFAMLQSIGMTGRQLRTMLIYEGLLYALASLLFSLVLTLAAGPLLGRAVEQMLWFYTYRLTLTPILLLLPIFLLLGVLLPLGSCRAFARQTLVERLRAAE